MIKLSPVFLPKSKMLLKTFKAKPYPKKASGER